MPSYYSLPRPVRDPFRSELTSENRLNLFYPISDRDRYRARISFETVSVTSSLEGLTSEAFTEIVQRNERQGEFFATKKRVNKLEDHNTDTTSRSSGSTVRSQENNTGKKVILYLPEGTNYREHVNYDSRDLGLTGITALTGINETGNIIDSALNAFTAYGISLTESLANFGSGNFSSEIARVGIVRLSSLAGSFLGGIPAATKIGTQTTIHPNTRPVLQSVQLRNFSFSFIFMATSEKEAEIIKKIILFFRKELYPRHINIQNIPGTDAVIPIGYSFPNKFEIMIYYEHQDNTKQDIVTRFKKCYLQGVDWSINNRHNNYFPDGTPVEYQMTLSFIEDSTLSQDDVVNEGL